MNKKLFFIWSIFLLAIVPLLAGCDKDDEEEEELILVESFEGTDGMEGEKILFELENVPAYVTNEWGGYVTIYCQENAYLYYEPLEGKIEEIIGPEKALTLSHDLIRSRVGVPLKDFETYDIPYHSRVYVTLSVTNVTRYLYGIGDDADWWWGGLDACIQKKAYLKDIRILK